LEELWAQQEEYESDIRERDEVCVCAIPLIGGVGYFCHVWLWLRTNKELCGC
jgi:hypothetical protein